MSCNSCNGCKSKQQEKEIKVVYLCDQCACDYCSFPLCKHTSDIEHAKNFKQSFVTESIVVFEEQENENIKKYPLAFFEYYLLEQLLYRGYQWIARDEDNDLNAFKRKPKYYEGSWSAFADFNNPNVYRGFGAFENLFEFIKCEDEQPTNIKELLNNSEVLE